MRVVNKKEQYIGYRMNLIGVRVYRDCCELVAHIDREWVPIGPPRALPVALPDDAEQIRSDALLATISQYERETPVSDLRDVLMRRKAFSEALEDSFGAAVAL
jgi:hypothetical protein